MKIYRQTASRRQAQRDAAVVARLRLAFGVARQAADWLKQTYMLDSVWLFGSLAENFEAFDAEGNYVGAKRRTFTLTSDIDLAIEQLPPGDYLTAIAHLQDISSEFKIDLVQLEKISTSFMSSILKEGRLL